jgi:hypothetical protein
VRFPQKVRTEQAPSAFAASSKAIEKSEEAGSEKKIKREPNTFIKRDDKA